MLTEKSEGTVPTQSQHSFGAPEATSSPHGPSDTRALASVSAGPEARSARGEVAIETPSEDTRLPAQENMTQATPHTPAATDKSSCWQSPAYISTSAHTNPLAAHRLNPIVKMHLVVVSGAGISAESGLGTFRGTNGLWEGVPIGDVATKEAWEKQPDRVLAFYNQRRRDVLNAEPNEAHRALAQLEELYDVTIITQNVDDLHERAGSSQVVHLHGEILKAQSTYDPSVVLPWQADLHTGHTCQHGSQLRPHVVLFGESVHNLARALSAVKSADFLIVVGTSLKVYPAAGILHEVPSKATKYLVDPSPTRSSLDGFEVLAQSATIGIPTLTRQLALLVE